MLFIGDSTYNWTASTDAANLAVNTTTYIANGASLEFDKTGTSATSASYFCRWPLVVDIQQFIDRGATLTYWTHHADYTSVATCQLVLVYGFDTSGDPSDYDVYEFTPSSAGWEDSGALVLDSPTSTTGSPDRERLLGFMIVGTTAVAGDTFSDLKFGPAIIELDDGRPIGRFAMGDSYNAGLVQTWDEWTHAVANDSTANIMPAAVEVVGGSPVNIITAGLDVVDSEPTREMLRRFSTYVRGNTDWEIQFDARQRVDTTVDTLSGWGTANSRLLYVTDTTDIEFLFDEVGLSDVYLFVGPNDRGQSEVVRVPGTGYVSSGSHVILRGDLAFEHEVGTQVRSATKEKALSYLAASSTLSDADPITVGDDFTFSIEAREGAP